MKPGKNILIPAIITCCTLFSCRKDKDLPPVPAIEYKDFVKYGNDSAVFSFNFTDGDGDMGLGQRDTFGVFSPRSFYYKNLFMKYYYKDASGAFVPYDTSRFNPPFDTAFFSYRIPDITPEGQNKVLDGEIRVKILAPYSYPDHQVIKFDAFIYDRALNRSNIITTSEITLY